MALAREDARLGERLSSRKSLEGTDQAVQIIETALGLRKWAAAQSLRRAREENGKDFM